jgi:response regulator RpfG family c-di-GMP phosphodiesterase
MNVPQNKGVQFKTKTRKNDELLLEEVWKILIVDDEPIMHSVTKLVLRDYQFEGRKLNFLSAFSFVEAKKAMIENPDVAVAFVDIVMEEDNSGLQFIHWLRHEQKNMEIRLILRTGQPGLAPERDIIQRYEINDYKEKTELTDVKLITSLTVAIRGYRDIHVLNRNRKGFQQILSCGAELWTTENTHDFLSLIIKQFQQIASGDSSAVPMDSLILQKGDKGCRVRLGLGVYKEREGSVLDLSGDGEFASLLSECSKGNSIFYSFPYLSCALGSRQEEGLYLITKVLKEPDQTDHTILSAFMLNASLAMDYWILSVSRSRSQKRMLYFLSEVIEQHFSETGNHIRRVSEMVYLMSRKLGIHEDQAENWRMASILHDLGKIGIPDHILKKPGKLREDEMAVMKSHVQIGYKMLSSNEDEFFPDAATIALSHHECWDGSGYPFGIKGEDISRPARILAVVDVFDALTHKRVYKRAWELDEALEFILERKGRDFEPALVDLFVENYDELKGILNAFPD